jgi:S-adenosylmethionine decarboxylase
LLKVRYLQPTAYMNYNKGKHIIASLQSHHYELLEKFESSKFFLDNVIIKHDLVNLGNIYHNFIPKGFTAVVCLSESHISIHTWPEIGLINLDIYLSNYQKNNDNTVEVIFESMVVFFNATIIDKQTLLR